MATSPAEDMVPQLLDCLERTVTEVRHLFLFSSMERRYQFIFETEQLLSCCVAIEDHIATLQIDMQLLVNSVCTLINSMEVAMVQEMRARTRGRPPLNITEDHLLY